MENIEFDKNTVIFGYKFNKEITLDLINEFNQRNVKKMIFNNYNQKELLYKYSNVYFDGIENNHWRGNRFNKTIEEFNKIDLECIVFGAKFNKEINNLPDSLLFLMLDYDFNKPLDNLPNKLKILCCKYCVKFSHSLDFLPESLEYIAIPPNFNKSFNNLPQNIKILDLYYISCSSNITTSNLSILPSNLETLIIQEEILYAIEDKIQLDFITQFKNKNNEIIEIINDPYNCFNMIVS